MTIEDPKPLTRAELAAFLPSQRAIRAFESLFALVPSSFDTVSVVVTEVSIDANIGVSLAQQALNELTKLADGVERLALAPPSPQVAEDNIGVPQTVAREDVIDLPTVLYDRDVPFGEFYVDSASITVVIAATSTPTEITSGMLTGDTNLTTVGGGHYVQLERGGWYEIIWSLSINTSTARDEIRGGWMINGVAQGKGTSRTEITFANKPNAMSASTIKQLSPGDQISLFVANQSAIRNVVIKHATLTIKRILV